MQDVASQHRLHDKALEGANKQRDGRSAVQGASDLARELRQAPVTTALAGSRLRFPMPAAVCPYCVGETAIGETHQRGNVKKMQFADLKEAAA